MVSIFTGVWFLFVGVVGLLRPSFFFRSEKLTPEQILKRELATGAPVIYRLNADSTVASKVDLAA